MNLKQLIPQKIRIIIKDNIISLLKVIDKRDIAKFLFYTHGFGPELGQVRINQLKGRAVFFRPKTLDKLTLLHTFYDQFHLPPRPLSVKPVILDLGVNAGYTVLHYKQLYPQAKIFGLEMDAQNYALAQKNTAGLETCQLINCAVSQKNGVFYYDKNNAVDAYSLINDPGKIEKEMIKVQAVSIPDLIRQYNLNRIDFIKMDIEGEENNIFKGEVSWLKQVDSLAIEVHGSVDQLNAIISVLQNNGFQAWRDTKHWLAVKAYKI